MSPLKPDYGASCNGCGLCCLAETCPVGRLRYLRKKGPCPALIWDQAAERYWCGILRSATWYRPLIERWIAAGTFCDSDVEIRTADGSSAED